MQHEAKVTEGDPIFGKWGGLEFRFSNRTKDKFTIAILGADAKDAGELTLAVLNESSREVVQVPISPEPAFRKYSLCSVLQRHSTWKEYPLH